MENAQYLTREQVMDNFDLILQHDIDQDIGIVQDLGDLRIQVGNPVRSVAFSPNGTQIVYGGLDTIGVWDIRQLYDNKNATAKVTFTHKYVGSVAFSLDGTQIVSGSDENSVRVWNNANIEPQNGFIGDKFDSMHNSELYSVAFSPIKNWIVSGCDYNIIVWDIDNNIVIMWGSASSSDVVNSVAFSPDGTQVVSGSTDKMAQVWDIRSGKPIKSFIHDGSVNSVAFSLDGTQIVSGSSDKMAQVWDIRSGKPIKSFIHEDSVNSVAFSPGGTQIVSGSSDSVRVWDIKSGRLIKHFKHEDSVNSVAFSPNGTQIVSGSTDRTIGIWNLENIDIDTDINKLNSIIKLNDMDKTQKQKIVLSAIQIFGIREYFDKYLPDPSISDEYINIINTIPIESVTGALLQNKNISKAFDELYPIYVENEKLLTIDILEKVILQYDFESLIKSPIFEKIFENIDRYNTNHISIDPDVFWKKILSRSDTDKVFWFRHISKLLVLGRFIRYSEPSIDSNDLYERIGLINSELLYQNWCMLIDRNKVRIINGGIEEKRNIFLYTEKEYEYKRFENWLGRMGGGKVVFSPTIQILNFRSGLGKDFSLGKIEHLILPEVSSIVVTFGISPIDYVSQFPNITELFMPSLTEIKINNTLTRNLSPIESLFNGNRSIEKVNLSSMMQIGNLYFNGCVNLIEIVLSNLNVIEGDNVFERCIRLKDLNLPKLRHIHGKSTFINMTDLRSISCPKLEQIQDDDLSSQMLKLGIPMDIPSFLFLESNQLISVDLSSLKNMINTGLFSNCDLSKCELSLSLSIIRYGSILFNQCKLPSIMTLDSIQEIHGSLIIRECANIEVLNMPNLIKIEGTQVFSCAKLKKIVANNLKELKGNNIFEGCTNLTDIYVDRLQVIDGNVLPVNLDGKILTIHLNDVPTINEDLPDHIKLNIKNIDIRGADRS